MENQDLRPLITRSNSKKLDVDSKTDLTPMELRPSGLSNQVIPGYEGSSNLNSSENLHHMTSK